MSVRGDDAPNYGSVTIRYGKKEGNGAVIGTTQADDDGDWTFRISNLNPAPCNVTAQAGSGDDDKKVRRAPKGCSNDGGGTVNRPPSGNANGPYSGTAGESISFDSNGSSDPDGSIASYAWTFGDGVSSNQDNPSHTYNVPGTYQVILTVTDKDGATGTDTTTATIVDDQPPPPNVSPTANANGSYMGTTGVNVNFSSDGSHDPDGSIVAFNWNFGDGSNSANQNHTYALAGIYQVVLTVTDKDGATGTDTTTATIADDQPPPPVNNPPACAIDTPTGNVTITVGASVNYSATVTDTDNDPLTISWSFGGGNPASGNIVDPGSISYDSAGVFTTTLNASDGQTGCAQQARTITVQDSAPPPVIPAPDVSINSTSRNSADEGVVPNNEGPVAEEPFVGNTTHRVIAINDLGMHCGDFDTRIASILPPFQALLAQVVQKGATPQLLDNTQVEVVYSAVSNPNDPILNDPNVFTGVAPDGSVFKTNFWNTVSAGAYDAFYPPQITPLAGGVMGMTDDIGLPVPNLEALYIGADGLLNSGDESLVATMHAMPGMTAPYLGNMPHVAEEFYNDKPFFVNFPFGYVAEKTNWFEGAGIPFAAFDDFGRENPYPLVRVQANVGGNTVATTDTVLPISGEASCKNCHSADVTDTPHAGAALVNLTNVADQLDDPALGNLPLNVSIEYATDINILRLHDQKHNTSLESEAPVVCQRCHYTPALDLAHVGPLGPENDPVNANGRTQLTQSTMSNVMHSHHGATGLFPEIPAPIQNADGIVTNQAARVTAMEESCYQCHPGKDTQCLRGAMFNGDMLCSDCHGNMQQVGADFSQNVSPTNVGAFELTGNFYDPNDPQPRVPWANEPGCGSCHTGDVVTNQAGDAGTVVNTRDMDGNVDGIRLRQAFLTGDTKATPIVPDNNRFAENIVPASFNGTANPGAGNPQLYRVSTGHGGVMCEGCHGATHAEWPNANPMSNDNVTANQLQGHTGTIVECDTCHTNVDSLSPNGSLQSLQGPHGMHAVGITSFADAKHKEKLDKDACRECHGQNGEGSVLSRTAADRDFRGIKDGGFVPKGTPVTCTECHSNKL
ncbi:MAG: PKD domain-containing protein [gamma proteobacterium endosymbiont of Lamellibrachia anaximandri]|nr:PKD domain-containing protein [gamma proteobacterium endosymbiont of Lamellibrachia anaximandri]